MGSGTQGIAIVGTLILLCLIVLAWAGRAPKAQFDVEAYVQADNDRLTAYTEHLRAANQATSAGDLGEIRSVARQWLKAADLEILHDTLPGDLSDQGESGVKDEIMAAKSEMADRLLRRRDEKPADDVLADAALVVRLMDVGKYGGLSTMSNSARFQQNALQRISDHVEVAGPDSRQLALEEIQKARAPEQPLSWIMVRMFAIHQRKAGRNGEDLSEADRQFYQRIGALTPDQATGSMNLVERLEQMDSEYAVVAPDISFALVREDRYQRALAETISSLEAAQSESTSRPDSSDSSVSSSSESSAETSD